MKSSCGNGSFEFAGDTKHLRLATNYSTDIIGFRQVTNDKNFLQIRTDVSHNLILEKMVNNSDTVILAEYAKKSDLTNTNQHMLVYCYVANANNTRIDNIRNRIHYTKIHLLNSGNVLYFVITYDNNTGNTIYNAPDGYSITVDWETNSVTINGNLEHYSWLPCFISYT